MIKKLKVFEAFSGYGSQSIALKRLGINYEVVAISEIDEYALKAYNALHGNVKNLGDISKIQPNNIPEHDLFTYSFPCQDISASGKQKGLKLGAGTRSSLLWECQRIISNKKPKFLLMENVKNLINKRHKPYFDKWCDWLKSQGYTNYWRCMNACDYNVPQNRERIIMVSILDNKKPFYFPSPIPLVTSLEDIITSSNAPINPRYYVSNDLENIFKKDYSTYFDYLSNSEHSYETKLIQVGLLGNKGYEQTRRVYSALGICPTLSTMQGGNTQPKIIETNTQNYRIRRVTPHECGLLMGLTEGEVQIIENINLSASRQYKLYGNSIVVPVLVAVFRELLKDYIQTS